MLGSLRLWGKSVSDAASDVAAEAADWATRRASERHDVTGRIVRLKLGSSTYRLHLKDISCSGASGLTDAPVEVGQIVYLNIGKALQGFAEVRWVRRVNIGVAFEKLLDPDAVARFVGTGGEG